MFHFVQKWLLLECFTIGWTCPESLELHKFFCFLDDHQGKIKAKSFRLTLNTIQKWRRVITSIRHAAVHRIPQDRDTLLQMNRVAINFSTCIVGFKNCGSLCRLYKFLKITLSRSNRVMTQLRQNIDSQISLCEARPQHLHQRLTLLPEAVKRVLERSDENFISEVKAFLQAEFK